MCLLMCVCVCVCVFFFSVCACMRPCRCAFVSAHVKVFESNPSTDTSRDEQGD